MKWGTVVTAAFVTLAGLGAVLLLDSGAFGSGGDLASEKPCGKGPLSQPRANCAPAPVPSTGNPYEDCVARINQLRWKCQCLPPLGRWKGGEACANKHAKHDSKQGMHAGFNGGICKPKGMAQNECPAWPSKSAVIEGCLQAMWDEGPGKRFSKHGHYLNMSNPRYEHVACGFAKSADGEVWSVQNFR
jgi:hypothetical protein